jgi:hypothetical protein
MVQNLLTLVMSMMKTCAKMRMTELGIVNQSGSNSTGWTHCLTWRGRTSSMNVVNNGKRDLNGRE